MRSDAAIRRAFTVTARSNLSPPADVCLRSHEESLVARFALFSFTGFLSLFSPSLYAGIPFVRRLFHIPPRLNKHLSLPTLKLIISNPVFAA